MGIVVMNPGPQTLVEDLGRPGYAALGLSPSGALDRSSLLLANALLGNPADAAGLEILLGGLKLRFVTGSTVAVTGAEGLLKLNGQEMPLNQAVRIAPGSVLEFGTPLFGVRYYLAVLGGIDVPPVLGSRSTDVLSGEGPPPLRAGDMLTAGRAGNEALRTPPEWAGNGRAVPPVRRAPDAGQAIVARVQRGPRADWFDDDSWLRLVTQHWTLSPESNRIGARLLGRPLLRVRGEELPSEGMALGALQVPPSGLPTIFLADHPVTGGYPVIAVVRRADLDLLAQLRPGQAVKFLG
jgi:biotin-dependent carboxylase-like uncharacterized protein